jgi:hypothetical protein
MSELLEQGGWTVETYVATGPETPPGRRFVAHAFDRSGRMQVATQTGASAEVCRERLTSFLNAAIAKAAARAAKPVTDDPVRQRLVTQGRKGAAKRWGPS